MDLQTLDYAAARNHMVDGQLRPNRIVEPRLVRTMRALPRERFLPLGMGGKAYIDEDIPLRGGRCLMDPLVLANLLQLARVREGERALVIGAGTGYGAAVLAGLGARVTALEEDETLLAIAREALAGSAPTVTLTAGPLRKGLPGPWDMILIEGAVPEIPRAIAVELDARGGRLVTVLAQTQGFGKGVLAEPINPGATEIVLRAQPHFDCATPLLPAFQPPPAFSF